MRSRWSGTSHHLGDPCCVLLVIHPGSVPTGCEEMCGTAPEAKKKMFNERNRRRGHQKAQHPHSSPFKCHIHVCCWIWNTMNALCLSVAALPQLPKWPPLASQCLWLSGERGAGIKKGLWHRRTRSSRKMCVPASRSTRRRSYSIRAVRRTRLAKICHTCFSVSRGTPRIERFECATRGTHGAHEVQKAG